ncbi:MAG: hypothetical protein AAGG57_06440 [Pseudomonadota bacterium]
MRVFTLFALFPIPLLASPIGEVICAPTAQMQTRLIQHMGSERTATGVRGPDEVMEVWTDAQGDWTMVVRYASGTSCIVAMGAHWEGARDPA